MTSLSSFQFQGHKVAYRREGAGTPMVFLHNGGTSHRIWEPLLERYAADHEVVAMDMLGFGASDRPHITYSLDLYVAQLGALLDELRLDDVTLIGHCMGSATVLRYAREHPERVRMVVAVNVLTEQTFVTGRMSWMVTVARRTPRLARAMAWLSAHLYTPKPVAEALARTTVWSDPTGVSRELREHVRETNRHPEQTRVLLNISENIGTFTGLEQKPEGVPVCVVWSADNKVLPASEGEKFCAALGPDRQVTLPRGGHLVMLETPDALAAVIDEFRSEVAVRDAAAA